jgi:shikimate dehydrogenase
MAIEEVLQEASVRSLRNKRVLLIGAGGTARTALAYVVSRAPDAVSIVNRGRKRLREMLSELGIADGSDGIEAHQLPSIRSKLRGVTWDIIINATPVATEEIVPYSAISSATAVFETMYGLTNRNLPPETRIIGGVDMLIFQALKGFEIFTGIEIENHRRQKAAVRRRLGI